MEKGTAFILILVLILGFSISQIYNSQKEIEIDVPSQCYTNLQPTSYFLDSRNILVDFNEENNTILIMNKDNRIFLVNLLDNTGSMRPTLSDDSIVISTKNLTKKDINVGDIVVYEKESGGIWVHRIMEIKDGNYFVKGDNNEIADIDPIKFEQIKAKVVGVLY